METPWYSCFNPCSVAQEQAKSFMLLRQYEKSFAFLQEAKDLSQYAAPRWVIPVTLTEGETYIRAARDVEPLHAKQMHNDAYYDIGIKQLLKGYELARNHNHLRQTQRVQ